MRPHPVELFLRTVIARAYPRVLGQIREPAWVFFDIVVPLLTTVGLVFFYRALSAPEEFLGFVILGGAMAAFWMNVLWNMAMQLFWEKESGNLGLYLMAPTTRMAVLLGMALGGLVGTSLKALVIVGVCNLAFGVQYDLAQWPLAGLVFLAAMAGVYAVGMLLASLYLYFTREVYHLNQLLQEPVYLLTGFYFPVRSLGMGVALAASVLPITLGLDGMRQLLFPPARATALLPVETELALLVVLFGVFFLLARVALHTLETLGKRDGRVTLRGQ
jgi:ABC-2 type transport system permease protein